MSEITNLKDLLININKCCEAIATRNGITLPPVGGFVKIPNVDGGSWSFLPGEGEYREKDGVMQWHLT